MPNANALYNEQGEQIPGHFIGAGTASIVILHDIFGLTNQMKGVGKRYAAAGFSVFLPDLYGGGKTTDDEMKASKLASGVVWKQAIERIRVVMKALAMMASMANAKDPKVGVIGFGFGGAMALAAASHIDTVAAVVSWYGIPTVDKGDLLRIACKVQGHFGNQDKKFTRDRVDALEARFKSYDIPAEIHRYHTQHFFFNEMLKATHSPYNTEISFRRSVDFLKAELGGGW